MPLRVRGHSPGPTEQYGTKGLRQSGFGAIQARINGNIGFRGNTPGKSNCRGTGGPEDLDRDTATMELECEATVIWPKASVRFRDVAQGRADRRDVVTRREGRVHGVLGGRGFWRAAASCSLSRTR